MNRFRTALEISPRILALVLLVSSSAICLALAYILLRNTLVNDGEWISTKEELGVKGVSGAHSFMRRTQALAGGRLNLDAWQGFQEVRTKDKMRLTHAEFDFLLDRNAYLCFEFKQEERSCGIRMSLNPDAKNIYFEANEDGAFTAQHEIALPVFVPGRWNHFTLSHAGGAADLRINGQPIDLGAVNIPECCSPAFRGGQSHTAVDNAAFNSPTGTILDDSFLCTDRLGLNLFYAVMLVFFLNLIYRYSIRMGSELPLPFFKCCLIFQAALSLLAAFVLGTAYVSAAWYPPGRELQRDEQRYLYNQWDWRKDEVLQCGLSNNGPARILFLGSSQTFGVGARTEQETFVGAIQRRLDQAAKGSAPYRCINAGINGSCARVLAQYYEESWIDIKPLVTVVNLGINDRWNAFDEYESGLRKIAQLDRERNIKTIFVNEARTWEHTEGVPGDNPMEQPHTTEEVMKKVAAEFGIPYVDANACLRMSRDQGFQWWDFVHPTSFGHSLIAGAILDELMKLPEIKALIPTP